MDKNSSLYQIKELSKKMDSEMLKILRESPIESNGTSICFDRQPSIFTLAELKYDNPVYLGFFRLDELLGFALVGYFKAFVNGDAEIVGHITNFIVKEKGRYRGFFYKASQSFFGDTSIRCRLGYAIIMKGNKKAESHITRRHRNYPDVPYTKIIDTLVANNIILLFRKRESRKYKIRTANNSDIDSIVSLLLNDFSKRLFAPYIDREEFLCNLGKRPDFGINNYYIAEHKNKIVGVCAAWDCSSFKQIRVMHYGKGMKLLKNFISVLHFLFGIPALPKEGEAMKEVYITDYGVWDRNPFIMNALLRRIYNDYKKRNYNLLIFGSSEKDPLLNGVKGFIGKPVRSSIIMGSKDKEVLKDGVINTSLPYIDIALL